MFPRLGLWRIDFPACPPAHGKVATRPMAEGAVDWWLDTGGDPARWPFKHERWRAVEAPEPAAVPTPPPEPRVPEPAPAMNTVLVKGKGGRKREVQVDAKGRPVF